MANFAAETIDTPTDSASTGQHNPMRNLSAISDMIQASELPAVVRERSIEVFTALGEAEAKTHDSTIDQVCFSRFCWEVRKVTVSAIGLISTGFFCSRSCGL